MRYQIVGAVLGLALGLQAVGPARADAPSGAIFTTRDDGSAVNENQFPDGLAVFLDGGPGPGAPVTAAGLDSGRYVFQVTDASGKTLRSTDPARCRRFDVSGGVIVGVASAGGCEHAMGDDQDHNARTVQVFQPGDGIVGRGAYKVWAVSEKDYLAACGQLNPATPKSDLLDLVDCGLGKGSANLHGFVPRDSKTDNFKIDRSGQAGPGIVG